jgi:hypothetical protein
LAAAALVWGAGAAPAVWAQAKLTAVEAEAPIPQTSTRTNLPPAPNQRSMPRNGLLRLEEQLSRSFQGLKPSSSSLEGLPAPALRPRVIGPGPNRRAKDLQEQQRKNWAFLNPDELTATPKSEELFNAPEYGSKGLDKMFSPVERFYLDLERRSAAKDKKRAEAQRAFRDPFRFEQEADDASLPEGIRDNAQNLRKLLGLNSSSSFAAPPSHGSSSDVFGLGSTKRMGPTEEELARKAYLDSFDQWLNRSTATTANNGLGLPVDSARLGTPANSGQPTFAPFNPAGNYDPSIGTVNPTLVATTPQDITAKVLNQWNPYWTPPKVEPPKTPPPQPIFDVPRRKF